VDIDRFKTVNDVYGFGRGDEFIISLARALQDGTRHLFGPPAFVGHVGGDDFVIICTPDQIRPLSEHAILTFEQALDSLYDPIDAGRGYLEKLDQRGETQRASLVTVSIGFALSTAARPMTPRDVSAAASEMKTVAKSQPGSYVAIDRRTVGQSSRRGVIGVSAQLPARRSQPDSRRGRLIGYPPRAGGTR